ncbi:hypothetical protein [Chamaesiphon sp. VAR_69_metabat_338]|uniref:hypothetical protein n=1 Tax=Chamaesiphon sp. VAR_69_metabat_338 TaxID=2964704 RepID=UPI00286D6D10|nr:hypothetical protein [Chamaesiphon sp. VAR_69_metabat_338]
MLNSQIVADLVIGIAILLIVNGALAAILRWHQQQLRHKAGTLLIALSRSRLRTLTLALLRATMAVIISLIIYCVVIGDRVGSDLWIPMSSIVIVSVLLSVLATTEIRESGIVFDFVWIPWSQIKSVRWTGTQGQTLSIDLRQPLELDIRKQLKIQVDPRLRPDLDRVFQRKLDRFN